VKTLLFDSFASAADFSDTAQIAFCLMQSAQSESDQSGQSVAISLNKTRHCRGVEGE
jgi:hypothetical protein